MAKHLLWTRGEATKKKGGAACCNFHLDLELFLFSVQGYAILGYISSLHGESWAKYNLTEPIPLQVEHVAIEFIMEPFHPSATHLMQRPCYQWRSPYQDPAGNQTTQRPPDHRKETQTAVIWSYLLFIRPGQSHLVRHSDRGKETRQTEEEVGRQHQGMAGLEFAKSQGATENREKWRKLVLKSSVMPQWPSQLRDRWWWFLYLYIGHIINVKLCMMVVLMELYTFILLSVTLIIFQGHSSVKLF